MNARLAARAEAHGLTRRADGAWTRERGAIHYVGCDEEGWWSGDPSYGHYATEDAALSATLDRFDHESPDRKLPEPSPGAQLAEAVRIVRALRDGVRHKFSTPEVRVELFDEVLRLLQSLALPPASDEGQVLLVAADYLLGLQRLPAGTEDAVVALLRAHPELVGRARLLGPWATSGPGRWVHRVTFPKGLCVLQVQQVPDLYGPWWWFGYDPASPAASEASGEGGEGDEGKRAAMAAGDAWARGQGWTPVDAEATPEPERLQRCEQCHGLGEWVDPVSRYGIASRCPRCHGSGREP